jgi:glucose/arabinose dehydrogenase
LKPQRLDTLVGKILRIVPDLREHTEISTVSENGRYRIPNDNPFATLDGARKEIWTYGIRNPHRLIWDVDPARSLTPTLLAFNIGLVTWETVVVIHKGANYGYSLREGTSSMSSTNDMGPIPDDDVIPVQVSDTVARGTVKPTYPVIQYSHARDTGGDAIANGFIYHGKLIPALRDKLVFGDIEKHLDKPPTPVTVRDDLPNPKSGHTWKFIAFGPDDMIYMSVGAPCNVCLSPPLVSAIARMKPDGTGTEVFADGVRNSVGFDWHPVTRELWFTDNGRDGLGDVVPDDERNIAPKAGLHFGYPFCHQGDVSDPQFGSQRACSTTEPPVQKLGAHVAAIGFTFYTGKMFPATYQNAAIIAQHGSWNRSAASGYRVMAALTDGRRVTSYQPLVDGFLPGGAAGGRGATTAASGRPVDVLQLPDGSILISDDRGNRLIGVSYRP